MTEPKIFRFFERGDVERHESLPSFHAFVWNHSIISPAQAVEVKAEQEDILGQTVLSLSYFNMLDRGLPEWRSPWFDWLRANTTQLLPPPGPGQIPPTDPGPGDPGSGSGARAAHAITWYNRDMIGWPFLTFAKVADMVVTQRNAFGGDGLYYDQFWRRVFDWMFSAAGAPYSAFPVHWWGVWRWCFDYAVAFGQEVTGGKVWANGEGSQNCHRIYEHAEEDYSNVLERWTHDIETGRESVLTVDAHAAPWAVDRAIADWTALGKGWIGFTTRDGSPEAAAQVDAAYVKADNEL